MAQSIASEVTSEQEKQFVCFVADAAESAAKTAVAQVKSSPCVSTGTPATASGASTAGSSARMAIGSLTARLSVPAVCRADSCWGNPQSNQTKDPWSSWSTKGF